MSPARRTPQRHRVVALAAILVATATALVASCDLTGGERASIEPPTSRVADGSSGGEAEPSSTASTVPVNDLLAPPPTDRPQLVAEDGMAPQVRRVDTTDRVIFITIDDGQVRDPAVLDKMLATGLPFTSFLTQPMAKADPAFWKGTEAAWGMIEAHTINHPNLRTASAATLQREICEPAETFEQLFGRRPTLFRPPYGNSSDSVRRVAASCDYDAVVLWTGSTNGGKLTMQEVDLKPGDIVLMHYRDTLAADLDDVMARARAEGFKIGRLEDYLSPGH